MTLTVKRSFEENSCAIIDSSPSCEGHGTNTLSPIIELSNNISSSAFLGTKGSDANEVDVVVVEAVAVVLDELFAFGDVVVDGTDEHSSRLRLAGLLLVLAVVSVPLSQSLLELLLELLT
jgi:hypothetical protein